MNTYQLMKSLKIETGLSRKDAFGIIAIFFGEMARALAKGDRVEIRGLFSFFVKDYDAYIGRNPKTGERVKIKPKKMPFFKCGKELKQRMNGKIGGSNDKT